MIINFKDFLLEGKRPTYKVPSLTKVHYILDVELNQLKFNDEKQLKIILNKFNLSIDKPTIYYFNNEDSMTKTIRRISLKWNHHRPYQPIDFIEMKINNKSWYFARLPNSRYKLKEFDEEKFDKEYSNLAKDIREKAKEKKKEAEKKFFELSKSIEYMYDINLENLYPIKPTTIKELFGIDN